MSTGDPLTLTDAPRYASSWLGLREPADAAARSQSLLSLLRPRLSGDLLIRDLGTGTGSMQRWLAPQLPGPQRWILQDHDADLLAFAASQAATTASDGSAVTVMTRHADLTELTSGDLLSTSLVTASALLDLLSRDEVDRLAAACSSAGCPALLTLSVTGAVEFTPSDESDAEFADGFAAHLRSHVPGRELLGPDAGEYAAQAFASRGATVHVASTPWRLDSSHAALIDEWLRGWVAAAAAQRPSLDATDYLTRRLDALATGELRVILHHTDLLALPRRANDSTSGAQR
ncbi:SAM-dependent methyltransferase [Cryptosporangium phraense]|uniref:SAM-dependent methyltransferase n=1 Tax=Cryptosporangium phraense TaxID=2593070 RepID=A0A545AXI1_9ACTN|nr:SAM-dependent methyltransferase [Cryptosporangium phraense]TQS45991.1 SAM-dependent methyltransferase [Cryptosporangium phraense]